MIGRPNRMSSANKARALKVPAVNSDSRTHSELRVATQHTVSGADSAAKRIRALAPRLRLLSRSFPFAACLLLILLAGCQKSYYPHYAANYREYAYVTNGGSATVTVIDVVNVRLDRDIAMGQNPVALAASPTRNEIYVVNSGPANGNGSLSIIDAESNSVVGAIPLHKQPLSVDVDSKGDRAYVANSGSNSVSVIDLKARREIAQIAAGDNPVDARISPDGKSLVVADRRGDSVTIINPETGRIRSTFNGCPGATAPVILKDSSKAFVACSAGQDVMVIALASQHPPHPDRLQTLMDVGRAPVNLALKPDGGEIFVSNSLSDSFSEVVTNSNDVLDATQIGQGPVFGLVSADNALLYVGNYRSQYVGVYSIDDGRRIASVRVGDGPSALALSAAGNLLFVVDSRSGDVAVVRTAAFSPTSTYSLSTLIPAGRDPNAIVDKAFKVR
jgi:YVTN family beta-propeller protein